MLLSKKKVQIETERMSLRPPAHSDFRTWSALRAASVDHLAPWEPSWATDHLTRKAFTNRVYWAQRSVSSGTALPLFLFRRSDDALMGAITLDNIPVVLRRQVLWDTGQVPTLPGKAICAKRSRLWCTMRSIGWTSAGLRPRACPKTPRRVRCLKPVGSSTKASRKVIFRLTGAGERTFFMHLCA